MWHVSVRCAPFTKRRACSDVSQMMALPTLTFPGAPEIAGVASSIGAKARDQDNERSRMAYLSELCP